MDETYVRYSDFYANYNNRASSIDDCILKNEKT
jgi:hypothetical protein